MILAARLAFVADPDAPLDPDPFVVDVVATAELLGSDDPDPEVRAKAIPPTLPTEATTAAATATERLATCFFT